VQPAGRLLLPEARELADRAAFEEVYRPAGGTQVRVNFVTSLDGAIEIGGTSGALGGATDRHAFMAMRAVADVILAGAGTIRAENYGPVKLDAGARRRRVERNQAPLPAVAVVTGGGGLKHDLRLFAEPTEGPRPIVVTTTSAAVGELEAVAEVIRCGDREVDVVATVEKLAERGLRWVLCEGGPILARRFLAAGLVDELCVTIAPQLAGAGRRSLSELWSGEPDGLHLESLIEGGGSLLARYRVEP
jgi:riboflavin biosynthesis pyrimidine reductase